MFLFVIVYLKINFLHYCCTLPFVTKETTTKILMLESEITTEGKPERPSLPLEGKRSAKDRGRGALRTAFQGHTRHDVYIGFVSTCIWKSVLPEFLLSLQFGNFDQTGRNRKPQLKYSIVHYLLFK